MVTTSIFIRDKENSRQLKSSGAILYSAQLYFYGNKDLGLFLKKERKLLFGNYYIDDKSNLRIILYTDRKKKSEFVWERLMPEKSERVREIDRLFNESYINNVKYETFGMELNCGVLINDLVVTKTKIILLSAEKEKYVILRDAYPFLKEVTPDIFPIVYKDIDDGRIYVEWEQLGCRIALNEFSKSSITK